MSVAEEAVRQAREAVHRALSVLDSFRPKILYKGNLTDLIGGQFTEGMRPLERLRKRLNIGLMGGRATYPAMESGMESSPPEPGASEEASGLIVEKKGEKETFIY